VRPHESCQFDQREDAIHFADQVGYTTKQTVRGRAITLTAGVKLTVTWRDSSGNYFTSSTNTGVLEEGVHLTTSIGAVKRIEAPLTEEEMNEAYAREEDTNEGSF